jgi:hypothetical protein
MAARSMKGYARNLSGRRRLENALNTAQIEPILHQRRIHHVRWFLIILLATIASPVMAEEYVRVSDRGSFIRLVGGKSLTSLGVKLKVSASGAIAGSAFGRAVTGTWTWNDGYFCRTMQAGGKVFERNCQVVQQNGTRLRFIADKGAGDTADLRIR